MSAHRFPADGVMLDACALFRMDKCEALPRLKGLTALHLTAQVHEEFGRDGPHQRGLLRTLGPIEHSVVPGSPAWDKLILIRGGNFSNQDLGEDESLAVCLAQADKDRFLPLVTFDRRAALKAQGLGVPVIDFLSLLSWLVSCGRMTRVEAEHVELLASQRNGWRRPVWYQGHLDAHATTLCNISGQAIHEWRMTKRKTQGRRKQTTRRKP